MGETTVGELREAMKDLSDDAIVKLFEGDVVNTERGIMNMGTTDDSVLIDLF